MSKTKALFFTWPYRTFYLFIYFNSGTFDISRHILQIFIASKLIGDYWSMVSITGVNIVKTYIRISACIRISFISSAKNFYFKF